MSSPQVAPPSEQFGYLLKRLQHRLRTRMDSALAVLELTTPQYAVMATLEHAQGASNADLARAAFTTPPTMIRILDLLERDGRIVRRPHPHHGRVRQTELTTEGRRCLKQAHRIVAPIEATLHGGLSATEEGAIRTWLLEAAQRLDRGDRPLPSGIRD